jgi:rhodanese-related sulfurtransferase/transcriptional regulator with XRE-family HTH domain
MESIGPRELEALIAERKVDVIDVRSSAEYATGHVPGARLVPLEQLRADPDKNLPRDEIVFVCKSGQRSLTAAKLAEQKWPHVYSLSGGTNAWIKSGLPVELDEPKREAPRSAPPAAKTPPVAKAAVVAKPAAEPAPIDPMPDVALDAVVGQNLRTLRTQRALTLDGLAQRAGVSRTLLGQIELGKTAPSINVVWKIAQALEVPFSTLLAGPAKTETTVLRRGKAKRLTSADGRFTSRALFPLDEPRTVEFYELWLAPHAREDADAHQPGTRENLVVTTGRLELKVGGEKYQLVAGDAILFRADVPHVYENMGNEECWMHLVMSYTTTVG